MDEWLLKDAVAQRVIHNMRHDGWVQLTKRDLLFHGDLLFIRDGMKKKELLLVNVEKSAKKGAYNLRKKYKAQADVFYTRAQSAVVISSKKQCKPRQYILPSALRRLRSMR